HDLPPLEAYKTSAVARRALRLRRTPADPAREARRVSREAAPPSVAAIPTLKAKPKPKPDPEPYVLLGIGVGSMRFSPFIETSGGYDTNPNRLPAYTGGGAPQSVYNSPVPSRAPRRYGHEAALGLGARRLQGGSPPGLCRLSGQSAGQPSRRRLQPQWRL